MARDDLITTAEACEILGDEEPLDRSTVSRWVQLGKLKYAKRFPGRNGAFLFYRADVEDLKQRNDADTGHRARQIGHEVRRASA